MRRISDRRRFISDAARATVALASVEGVSKLVPLPTLVPGAALGLEGKAPPSETIRLGGIGINARGGYDLGFFLNQRDVRFVAVADVARTRRERVKARAEQEQGTNDVAMYRDFRDLLDRSDVDAVLIATGDRWHAHMSIYAARAGKDVYSEKPCAISIDLCLKLAETMKFYGTVFQGGTQRRNVVNFKSEIRRIQHEQQTKPYTRKCEVCGRTDTDFPELEFRYCSRCAGYHCFCIDHINDHRHRTE